MPSNSRASIRSSGDGAPERIKGGAAKESRSPSRRITTRPAPHSWTISFAFFGRFPAASQAWQLPSVGWPANGISLSSVNILTL